MKRLLPFAGLFLATILSLQSQENPFKWRTVEMGGGGFVSGLIANPTKPGLIFARTDVGGAYRWQNETEEWIPLTDWLSPDELSFMGVESLATDPVDPDRIYMIGGTRYWNKGRSAVLRSADAGKTWEVVDVTKLFRVSGNSFGRQTGEKLVVDPNKNSILLCGTRFNGLFRSEDYGKTWTQVKSFGVQETPGGNGISWVVFDPSSGKKGEATPVIYAGVCRPENNIYVSKDAGATWALVPGGPKGLNPQRNALGSNGMLYLTFANGSGPHGNPKANEPMSEGAVWKLDTQSGEWTNITPANRKFCFSGISVDATNPERVAITTVNIYHKGPWGHGDKIYLTEDGGNSWKDLFADSVVSMENGGFPWLQGSALHWAGSILIDPSDPNRAFVTSGQGIFMTNDLGADESTWKFVVRGLEETVPIDAVSIEGGPFVSVVLDYDGFTHDDVTKSPEHGNHEPGLGSTTGLAAGAKYPNLLIRMGGKKMQISEDRGVTWKPVPRSPHNEVRGGRFAIAADNSVILYVDSSLKRAFRTTDKGKTWEAVPGVDFNASPVADPVNPKKFYLYNTAGGQLFASEDGAATFAPVGEPFPGGSFLMRAAPGFEGHLWLPMAGRGLAVSQDGGMMWEKIDGVTNAAAVGHGKAAPGAEYPTLFIWGSVNDGPPGVYGSIDRGHTWTRITDDDHEFGGLANGQFVVGDLNVFGRVYMSSAGRGIPFAELRPGATWPGLNEE